MALVITGSPGVGKHMIASMVARDNDLYVVDINDVAKKTGLVGEGGVADTDGLAREMMEETDEDNDNALIVGHLAPYVLDLQANRIEAVAVLRRSPYDLEGVYERRGYPRAKSLENLGAEILGIIAHDAAEKFGGAYTFQINNTTRTPEQAAAAVGEVFGHRAESEPVDWLAEVKKRGDLRRFFRHGAEDSRVV